MADDQVSFYKTASYVYCLLTDTLADVLNLNVVYIMLESELIFLIC